MGRGCERSAYRRPHTLTQAAHASRSSLTLPRPLTLADLRRPGTPVAQNWVNAYGADRGRGLVIPRCWTCHPTTATYTTTTFCGYRGLVVSQGA